MYILSISQRPYLFSLLVRNEREGCRHDWEIARRRRKKDSSLPESNVKKITKRIKKLPRDERFERETFEGENCLWYSPALFTGIELEPSRCLRNEEECEGEMMTKKGSMNTRCLKKWQRYPNSIIITFSIFFLTLTKFF